MATNTNKNYVAEKVTAKYCIAVLRANCNELLGVTTSTFDGAFYGKTNDMTVEEARKTIDIFLNKQIGG